MTLTRSPEDAPLIAALPAGTTDRDYSKFYCMMSYAQFISLLESTQPNQHA